MLYSSLPIHHLDWGTWLERMTHYSTELHRSKHLVSTTANRFVPLDRIGATNT